MEDIRRSIGNYTKAGEEKPALPAASCWTKTFVLGRWSTGANSLYGRLGGGNGPSMMRNAICASARTMCLSSQQALLAEIESAVSTSCTGGGGGGCGLGRGVTYSFLTDFIQGWKRTRSIDARAGSGAIILLSRSLTSKYSNLDSLSLTSRSS